MKSQEKSQERSSLGGEMMSYFHPSLHVQVQPLSRLCSIHSSLPPLGYLSPIYDLIEPYPILSLSMYVHDRTRDNDNDDDDGYNDLALFLSTDKSNSKRKSNK